MEKNMRNKLKRKSREEVLKEEEMLIELDAKHLAEQFPYYEYSSLVKILSINYPQKYMMKFINCYDKSAALVKNLRFLSSMNPKYEQEKYKSKG